MEWGLALKADEVAALMKNFPTSLQDLVYEAKRHGAKLRMDLDGKLVLVSKYEEELAFFKDGKMEPRKQMWEHSPGAKVIALTEDGYYLVKNGDNLGIS